MPVQALPWKYAPFNVAAPNAARPPPLPRLVLVTMVVLLSVSVPLTHRPPPTQLAAVQLLFWKRPPLRVSAPTLTTPPPPATAVLLRMLVFCSTRAPLTANT